MIYLFYPSKIMGGAEYLLLRTANLLSEAGYAVTIIDINKGWISDNVKNPNIKIIKLGFNKIRLEDNATLITPASLMYKLDSFFHKSKTKILFWVLQPYNIIIDFPKIAKQFNLFNALKKKYLDKKIKQHQINLKLLIDKQGIIAMDNECNDILYQNYRINYKQYLPVFIKLSNKLLNTSKVNSPVRILWLGRIDLQFKIHILKKLLSDINNIYPKIDVVFNVIGNGPGLPQLIEFCKENINFPIHFLKEQSGQSLNEIIEKNDIGFAMGTSALNIASRKIPTILLDFSYYPIKTYNYRWLYESDTYTLGRDIQYLSKNEIEKMHHLKKIFNDLLTNKKSIAKKCFDYVCQNHSEKRVKQKIKTFIHNIELDMSDIYGYRHTKPFWNNISAFILKIKN